MKRQLFWAGFGVVALGAGVFFLLPKPGPVTAKLKPTDKVAQALAKVDDAYGSAPVKAEAEYREFVATHAKSPDKAVQDSVGKARLRLGYLVAKKDFSKAREVFLETKKEYKGTGAMNPEFGSIPDQALYQAAVCLAAEGKSEEAEKEFVKFIQDRPRSPLVQAAHKRLARLNGGESKPEWDELLQKAVTKQEDIARFEMSVCGPKSIAYLLPRLGKEARTYQEIAKLCGTTDSGTTMEGMRKGLSSLGIESYAYRLNRQDLPKAKFPLLLLKDKHYLAAISLEGDVLTVYDPTYGAEMPLPLPSLDNPDFVANVILFSKPEVQK